MDVARPLARCAPRIPHPPFRCVVLALTTLVAWLAIVAPSRADLASDFRARIAAADLKQAKVGILVVDLSDGDELVKIDADDPLIPASNLKLVTTATALRVLGPDFTFRTELSLVEPADWKTDGPAGATAPSGADAVTPGRRALLVRGDGDPGFGDPELLRAHNLDVEQLLQLWVRAVKQANLTAVDQLIIDDRVFDDQRVHPTWPVEQLDSWYCAQVSGLNFYDNCIDVIPELTATGTAPRIRLMPAAPFLPMVNRAQSAPGAKEDSFVAARKLGGNELVFRGQVKVRRTQAVSVTVHDPAMFFGQVLADRLKDAGVKIGAVVKPDANDRLPRGKPLHVVETSLAMVLQRCNKDSQNLFAEALIKRVGRASTGQPGSWQNGAAVVRAYLSELIGPSAASVSIADGSGMSRNSRVTPRVLVSILAAMHRDPKAGRIYRQSLSVGGSDGTLQKRFKDLKLNAQVLGKSGYIHGVSTLSGYLVMPGDARPGAPSEKVVAFSFLFNDFKHPIYAPHIKALQDDLVRILDKRLSPATPRTQLGG